MTTRKFEQLLEYGPRIPALHWYPARGTFDPEPELSAEIELQVWNTLYPFKLSG